MGDHFVLLVDRLLTESTLEAAIESKNGSQQATPSAREDMMTGFSSHRMDVDVGSSPRKLVECRICHDEDEDSNMEIPCSCCGSLKQFRPGYTAPPPLFHYGGIPMNFRGNWEISRRDLHDSQFIAMVATDNNSVEPDFDEYSAPSSTSLICCRIVAIIVCSLPLCAHFMVLLVLRHTLPVLLSGAGDYSITLSMLLMLRTIGILLPIYIMVKAFTAIQRRRHQQDPRRFPLATSDEENELPQRQPQTRLIQVR
ncbi:hypothetical protein RJ640_010973 [Escallonia rubra]|uniref:RING/FYVE/PHD zinc finger superfamily protein n=1 Tax=Escallonia rubra TaxID=112253 RepID=A0AA88RCC3_9ASTE|nr:hypothetical protein RJ640_010973 [Escallonia rubra]